VESIRTIAILVVLWISIRWAFVIAINRSFFERSQAHKAELMTTYCAHDVIARVDKLD